jgi:mannosylglycerate hydrolase
VRGELVTGFCSHLWLTLLRCVGWLSRDDLATREGHAGPAVATPGAQCPGVHRFEYALSLAPLEGCALVRAAQDYRFPFVAGPPGAELRSPLLVHGDACFATLKGAEDGEGTVLRLYNPGREPAHARVEGPFDVAAPARLDESVSEPVDLGDSSMEPGKILTLRLLPRARHMGEPGPVATR